jgi:sugar phosphate isomerase/epimerase
VRLGVAIPATVGQAGQSLEWTLARCVDMGIVVVELSGDTLDSILGVPVATVPLEPPPADGLALGLLELEEDVLRDSYELARHSFDAQIRAWRATVSLAPLADLQRTWRNAGVSIDVVSVPDLGLWSDDEVDYACRAARAAGARVLATRASLAGPRRVAPFAHRHDVLLSFVGETTGAADLDRILEHDDRIAVALDLDAWTIGGHGSPLPFLRERAPRVSHVRWRAGSNTHMAELLRAMRANDWDFPAMIVVDPRPDDDDWYAGVTKVLAASRE